MLTNAQRALSVVVRVVTQIPLTAANSDSGSTGLGGGRGQIPLALELGDVRTWPGGLG